MDNSLVEQNKISVAKDEKACLNWQSSPALQRLLDVVASILVEEYIGTARQNPEVFLKNGIASRPSVARNDADYTTGGRE